MLVLVSLGMGTRCSAMDLEAHTQFLVLQTPFYADSPALWENNEA